MEKHIVIEWAGPQQGPLYRVSPLLFGWKRLAAVRQHITASTLQAVYVERILTAASKASACMWQQFINIPFLLCLLEKLQEEIQGPHWQDLDSFFLALLPVFWWVYKPELFSTTCFTWACVANTLSHFSLFWTRLLISRLSTAFIVHNSIIKKCPNSSGSRIMKDFSLFF